MTDAIINKAKQISMVESKIADDTDKNLCRANVELRPFLDQTQRRTAHLNGCINTKARENAIDKRIDNKAMVKGMGARNRTFDQLPSAKKKNERVYLSRHQLVRTKTGSTKNTPGALAPSSTPVRNIAMTGKPKSSSILLVRTQNDSLRSSYGSTEHLRSRQMRRGSTSNSFLRHSASSTTSMQKNQTFEATLRQNQHTRRIAASASSLSLSGSLSSFTNVSFDKVCVREYNRCVGDNVPSKGPPISIGWKYESQNEHSVDDYEYERHAKCKRKREKLRMDARERVNILDEHGSSFSEIMRAASESSSIRKQRMQTITRPKSADQIEEFMESTRKKLKKVSIKQVFRRKSNGSQEK
mmetsp:Transcript_47/g.104  ORF Transcript_47/g.104 Transcript_47/m.104 type:complete len:356 (+) Transcript_47:226-1293(+)